MKSIAESWDGFRDKVIPMGSPKVQYEEMEKAFYAGYWSCLQDFFEQNETVEMSAQAAECEEFVNKLFDKWFNELGRN